MLLFELKTFSSITHPQMINFLRRYRRMVLWYLGSLHQASSRIPCSQSVSSYFYLAYSELFLWQITLQRDTIDIGGKGQLTLGKLPDGIDNSSVTWVPVRLYTGDDGGLFPPSFAPNEVSIAFSTNICAFDL